MPQYRQNVQGTYRNYPDNSLLPPAGQVQPKGVFQPTATSGQLKPPQKQPIRTTSQFSPDSQYRPAPTTQQTSATQQPQSSAQ